MVLTEQNQIHFARLLTLRAALKLETKGLKRHGPSALSILRREGYVKARTAMKALEELNNLLTEWDAQKGEKP